LHDPRERHLQVVNKILLMELEQVMEGRNFIGSKNGMETSV